MAYIAKRKNKAGEVTSYQVKWRLGGARDGDWQTERFDDEDSAGVFKEAVDEHGQQWPPGWVKGRGYIDPAAVAEERYRFDIYARESIKNRTGIEDRPPKLRTWGLTQRLRPVEPENAQFHICVTP